jgi:hypothetical protein
MSTTVSVVGNVEVHSFPLPCHHKGGGGHIRSCFSPPPSSVTKSFDFKETEKGGERGREELQHTVTLRIQRRNLVQYDYDLEIDNVRMIDQHSKRYG